MRMILRRPGWLELVGSEQIYFIEKSSGGNVPVTTVVNRRKAPKVLCCAIILMLAGCDRPVNPPAGRTPTAVALDPLDNERPEFVGRLKKCTPYDLAVEVDGLVRRISLTGRGNAPCDLLVVGRIYKFGLVRTEYDRREFYFNYYQEIQDPK